MKRNSFFIARRDDLILHRAETVRGQVSQHPITVHFLEFPHIIFCGKLRADMKARQLSSAPIKHKSPRIKVGRNRLIEPPTVFPAVQPWDQLHKGCFQRFVLSGQMPVIDLQIVISNRELNRRALLGRLLLAHGLILDLQRRIFSDRSQHFR